MRCNEASVRFGVVGTNFISREFVSAGQTLPDFSLAAVCSRSRETGEAFANGFGGARCFTDAASLAKCSDVTAVYVASPNSLHAAQAEQMLRAGKHVLLEKPACPDRQTFARLCNVAQENGVILLEAMRPAFLPGFAAIKDAIAAVGTVRRVSFSYCQYSSRYDKYKNGIVENAFDPSLCNGALMDIGVYCAHALVALFGTPQQVSAFAQRLENGLDAQGSALCRYDGMLADLSYSKIADGRRQNEIQGEAGTLLIDSITNPKQILYIARNGEKQVLYADPNPEFFGMAHEIRAFMDYIAQADGGTRNWTMHNDTTCSTLSLMDEIRRQTGIDFVLRQQQSREVSK